MAQQNKAKLKTYYQTGDIPTSNQYGELIDSSLNLAETALQVGEFSVSSSGNLKMMGSASFVGDITSSGDIKSSGTITCASLNTGQGITEVHLMNQNVRSNDIVTFAGINISKTSLSAIEFGASVSTSGQSFSVTLQNIPAINGFTDGMARYTTEEVRVDNSNISEGSLVVGTSTSDLLAMIYGVAEGSFKLRIGNASSTSYGGGNALFNFIVF
tara:strand:- start:557 stop:1198 length:642 start_codon:yes stop_codon:yes gene_type:complete